MGDMPAVPDRTADAGWMDIATQLMAAQSGAADHALSVHRRAPNDRCTGCGPGRVRWPCVVVVVARRALGTSA